MVQFWGARKSCFVSTVITESLPSGSRQLIFLFVVETLKFIKVECIFWCDCCTQMKGWNFKFQLSKPIRTCIFRRWKLKLKYQIWTNLQESFCKKLYSRMCMQWRNMFNAAWSNFDFLAICCKRNLKTGKNVLVN